MTAAYLDPFAQIVGLNRTATGYAVLIAEFPSYSFNDVYPVATPSIAAYLTPEEPVPAFETTCSVSERVGEVRIWNIDVLLLSNDQGLQLSFLLLERPYWFDTGLGSDWPPGPTGWEGSSSNSPSNVFTTQEGAIAEKLGVSVSQVHRGAKVADAFINQYGLLKVGSSTQYRYNEAINIPANQLLFGAQSVGSGWWDYYSYVLPGASASYTPKVVVSSAPLDAVLPPVSPYSTIFSNSKGLLLTNNRALFRNDTIGLVKSEVFVDGETFVPPVVTGETRFNTQRTVAIPYESTVLYPDNTGDTFLVAEFDERVTGANTYSDSSSSTTYSSTLVLNGSVYLYKGPSVMRLFNAIYADGSSPEALTKAYTAFVVRTNTGYRINGSSTEYATPELAVKSLFPTSVQDSVTRETFVIACSISASLTTVQGTLPVTGADADWTLSAANIPMLPALALQGFSGTYGTPILNPTVFSSIAGSNQVISVFPSQCSPAWARRFGPENGDVNDYGAVTLILTSSSAAVNALFNLSPYYATMSARSDYEALINPGSMVTLSSYVRHYVGVAGYDPAGDTNPVILTSQYNFDTDTLSGSTFVAPVVSGQPRYAEQRTLSGSYVGSNSQSFSGYRGAAVPPFNRTD